MYRVFDWHIHRETRLGMIFNASRPGRQRGRGKRIFRVITSSAFSANSFGAVVRIA